MPIENPLTWTSTAPEVAGCVVEHFRHRDGRQIRVLNPDWESDEDGSCLVFESFQIFDGDDWIDPTDEEEDELTSDIRDACRHQLDWST